MMSDVDKLKSELEKVTNINKAMQCQVQAHKQIINELVEQSTVTRTNMLLIQRAYEDATKAKGYADATLVQLNKQIEELTKSNDALNVELNNLKNPPAPASDVAVDAA